MHELRKKKGAMVPHKECPVGRSSDEKILLRSLVDLSYDSDTLKDPEMTVYTCNDQTKDCRYQLDLSVSFASSDSLVESRIEHVFCGRNLRHKITNVTFAPAGFSTRGQHSTLLSDGRRPPGDEWSKSGVGQSRGNRGSD